MAGLPGIQQPPVFLKSNCCLFMPPENVFFNGGSLKPEETQPKRHLEATKIKIPKISLSSSESSL